MGGLVSVSEYAKLHEKDPGNIRRLLASGRMKGEKVGKQWVMPEDAVYPEDRRVSSGKYRNWRKRVTLNENKELMRAISAMIMELRFIYGSLLSEIILYGSYARGTQTSESDVDVAIILAGKPSRELTDKMVNCVSSYELECGKVLSVIDIDSEKYTQWKSVLPFYKNIQKEGLVLWKAAE